MDWDRYKAECDRPDVLSRWLLEQTLELVDDPALIQRLREALTGVPVPRPADHRAGRELDMLEPGLGLADVEAVHRAVAAAAAAGRTSSATRRRGLGGFVEAWDEYRRWLNRTSGTSACSARS